MNMIIQSLAGGSNALASTAGTTASASDGTSTAVPFAQTLIQSMGGGGETGAEDTPLLADLATLLQGLTGTVQTTATGEDSGEQTSTLDSELVDGLPEDLEKLDEAIASDPVLLAALQGWLLQVSALLSGGTGGSETGAADAAPNTLSPLAQNPETLRFAVQDELNSLVSLVQDATAGGDGETAAKGISLLNDFTEVLTQAQTPGTGNNSRGSTPGGSDSVVNSLQHVLEQATDAKTAKTDSQQSAVAVEVEDTGAEPGNAAMAKSSADGGTDEGTQEETFKPADITADSDVVTVGQLSIQQGINSSLKSEKLLVPMHKFAQEMSSFIGGKLEIVNKEGVLQATISLFPENLGQVDVKITLQNGHLVAQFVTEHSGAKDMLEQQMSQLRASLQSQGLQVERLEVTQNNTPLLSQFGQENKQQGSGGQQSGKRSKNSDEDVTDAILAAELNNEYNEWVAELLKGETNQGGLFSTQA